MAEEHGYVNRNGDLVASCAFCRWSSTHRAIQAPPEDLIRETIEAIAFLRARLIEHVEFAHPELMSRPKGS